MSKRRSNGAERVAKSTKLVFRVQAIQRMFQRGISEDDVRRVLAAGDVIEAYPDDTPYPSRLVLGWIGARPIHIVVADYSEGQEAVIVTVYEPDRSLWEPGFRNRRKQ